MDDHYSQLVRSVVEFTHLLRKAGIKLGTDVVIKASQAVSQVPLKGHADLYWALKASLINNHQDEEIFNQVFALYWGNAKLPDSALAVSLPRSKVQSKAEKSFSQRTLDAFNSMPKQPHKTHTEVETIHLSWSDQERLQTMDFEAMSSEEFLQAQRLLNKMRLTFKPTAARRFISTPRHKRIDFRQTFKNSTKYDLQLIDLKHKKPKLEYPSLVLFIDISGSMNRYSRIMLKFTHLLNQARDHVHVFLFATQLTPITRQLGQRDMEQSLQQIGQQVHDFDSGTKTGTCIKYFNNNYLKNIVNSKSRILFVTDGLDRGDQVLLERQLQRLKRASKTIIWLNPLLRFDEYEPKARGADVLSNVADKMLPIHNLQSLEQLIEFLHLNLNKSNLIAA